MSDLIFVYSEASMAVAFSQYRDVIELEFGFSGGVGVTIPDDSQPMRQELPTEHRDEARLLCGMSELFCPFPDLLAWLEAIACGVQECAFDWEAEGPAGRLYWRGRDREAGFLTVSWWSRKETIEYTALLDTHQAVAALYTNFRKLVDSASYDPIPYEKMPAGDVFALVIEDASLDDLADHLAACSRTDARKLIDALVEFSYRRSVDVDAAKRQGLASFVEQSRDLASPEEDQMRWIPTEWDYWTTEQRRKDVVDGVFTGGLGFAYGSKLRSLRSSLVEHWLARGDEPA